MSRVFKIGDDIDTDQLAPSRYVLLTDPKEIASHCLERLRPELASSVQPGDVLLAGSNFGCGSSRERAAVAVKHLDVRCVIAGSFARLFYRNAINIGLPILECPEAVQAIEDGDEIEVDIATGTISCPASGKRFVAQPLPEFVAGIVEVGGLLPYARRLIAERAGQAGSGNSRR